jgi:hypothetical protein
LDQRTVLLDVLATLVLDLIILRGDGVSSVSRRCVILVSDG